MMRVMKIKKFFNNFFSIKNIFPKMGKYDNINILVITTMKNNELRRQNNDWSKWEMFY